MYEIIRISECCKWASVSREKMSYSKLFFYSNEKYRRILAVIPQLSVQNMPFIEYSQHASTARNNKTALIKYSHTFYPLRAHEIKGNPAFFSCQYHWKAILVGIESIRLKQQQCFRSRRKINQSIRLTGCDIMQIMILFSR